MSDPSLPLQAALVAALKAAAGVTALVSTRVYDAAPESPTFPYVTLGDGQVIPDKADCIDGVEIFAVIDCWSRANGYPEVKRLAAAVVAALDDNPQDLTVAGYNLVIFEIQSVNYMRDPDGQTRHAALTFHAVIQAA